MTDGAKKGRVAEREVAKILQKWWRQLEPDCDFRRTPSSGGWLGKDGVDVRAHFKACGDIMTTAEKWPFTVEVKRREVWVVDRLFKGKKSPVWEWWRQALEQADEEGGVAMLWARKNQYRPGQPAFPWFVILPRAFYLNTEKVLPKPDVEWMDTRLHSNEVDYGGVLPVMWFYDRFLKTSPKKLVRKLNG